MKVNSLKVHAYVLIWRVPAERCFYKNLWTLGMSAYLAKSVSTKIPQECSGAHCNTGIDRATSPPQLFLWKDQEIQEITPSHASRVTFFPLWSSWGDLIIYDEAKPSLQHQAIPCCTRALVAIMLDNCAKATTKRIRFSLATRGSITWNLQFL